MSRTANELFVDGIKMHKQIKVLEERLERINHEISKYLLEVMQSSDQLSALESLYRYKKEKKVDENTLNKTRELLANIINEIEFLLSDFGEIEIPIRLDDKDPYHPRTFKIVKKKVPNLNPGLPYSTRIQIEEAK